jgi:ankyrin repeat protein
VTKDIKDFRTNQGAIVKQIASLTAAMHALEEKEYEHYCSLSPEAQQQLKSELIPIPPHSDDMIRVLDSAGYCFGLSAYLMHCSISEYHIKKGNGETESSTEEYNEMLHSDSAILPPHTTREFYQMLDYFSSLQIPENEAEQKILFKRIHPFIAQIIQLQAAPDRYNSVEPSLQEMLGVLNEATGAIPEGYYSTPINDRINMDYDESQAQDPRRRNLVSTYTGGDGRSLIYQWSTKAQPGDVLAIRSKNHEMCVYVRSDQNGKNLVGIYDPNDFLIEIDQEELKLQLKIPDKFQPLKTGGDFVICEHIVPGDKDIAESKINIPGYDLFSGPMRTILEGGTGGLDSDRIMKIARAYHKETTEQQDQDNVLHALLKGRVRPSVFKSAIEEFKVDINAKNSEGKALVHFADRAPHLKMLLEIDGIDVHAQDKGGQTLMHKVASKGHPEMITIALDHPEVIKGINTQDASGKTALHCLLEDSPINSKDHLDSVERFLKVKDIDLLAVDYNGNTILHTAFSNLKINPKILEKLIEIPGIDFALKNHNNQSVLDIALTSGNIEAIKKIREKNKISLEAFQESARCYLNSVLKTTSPDLEMISYLSTTTCISYGAKSVTDYVSCDTTEVTAPALKALFLKQGSINMQHDDGLPMLHLVVKNGRPRDLLYLLSIPGIDIDINAKDTNGNTALEYLVKTCPTSTQKMTHLINASTEISPDVLKFCLAQPALKQAIDSWAKRVPNADKQLLEIAEIDERTEPMLVDNKREEITSVFKNAMREYREDQTINPMSNDQKSIIKP